MTGKASIISTGEPDSFTPGVEFRVRPTITNVGGDGTLWVHLIDRDTGAFLDGQEIYVSSGRNWTPYMYVTLTQTTDFHGRLQAGHVEGMVVDDTKDFNVPVTEASCTASFRETSVEVGATIHADFTWSNAVYRGFPYYHYALMNIKDPNGSVCAQHFELTNSSGSKSLSCVTDMAGTWKCQIDVWQGVFYVSCTDTVSVTAPPKPTVSFSAYPTTIERGQSSKLTWSTNYATSVKINNVTKALSGSEYVYPTTTTTYTLVATGAGGTTTKSVTVTVTEPPPPPVTTAEFYACLGCGWWPGPFQVGMLQARIADYKVTNTGDQGGLVYVEIWEYPGESGYENKIYDANFYLEAGATGPTTAIPVNMDIPNLAFFEAKYPGIDPPWPWDLCARVRGMSEEFESCAMGITVGVVPPGWKGRIF